MTDPKLTKYLDALNDSWKLFKRFALSEETDTYWKDLIDQMDQIYQKHHFDFAKKILFVMVAELDNLAKEKSVR